MRSLRSACLGETALRRTMAIGILWVCLAVAAQETALWRDLSPHSVQFVRVGEDIRLKVLHWGGRSWTWRVSNAQEEWRYEIRNWGVSSGINHDRASAPKVSARRESPPIAL
jgi:hypothetical protein